MDAKCCVCGNAPAGVTHTCPPVPALVVWPPPHSGADKLRAAAARFRAYAADPGLCYARHILLVEAARLEEEARQA